MVDKPVLSERSWVDTLTTNGVEGLTTNVSQRPTVRELLDKLIEEMVGKGILYDDAQQEFERRFITRVLATCDGNLSRAAQTLGMHRNTLSRKVAEYRLKRRDR